ncbi:SGNH/GDSL hydrolase family protein [Arthrobacter sp. ISL-95]|uniref:SGNH/GDSL hydrolase family protein n=1 Tax=Arthrobacter sp. ISL-95 TaxID=2819116 RepID=UPI001BE9D43F|nr:SGNH/GDSL hydrolase family protein [Arthrobacter sp. ISL-95]MBT2585626.1 SGNH/GDSL hydrolase family protein [Arthrobacter sp. ISL-95]
MMKSARGRLIAGVAVLALVVGAIGIRQWQVASSNERNCAAVSGWLETRGDFAVAGVGGKRVAVLGDSYTAGEKLQDRSAGWVFDLAHDQGWTLYADGIGNTGFTGEGFCGGQAFSSRTGPILDLAPELAIVQGGLNDTAANSADVEAAASALLEDLKSVHDVVLVGPVRAPARQGIETVDSALATAAGHHGRRYVSALDWDLPFLPDNLHLTEDGHARYAKLLAARLTSEQVSQ